MSKIPDLSVNLKNTNGFIRVGEDCKTKVNALVGISNNCNNTNIIELLKSFEMIDNPPHIVTDLSLVGNSKDIPIWKRVVLDSPFVASTVPVYLAKWYQDKLDAKNLLEIAIEQMEGGVGLITIHPTPTLELINLSNKRLIPCTSRGGGMVARDLMKRNHLSENVYIKIMDDLIKSAKRTNTVLSIGTTYRPGCIFDSLDEAHINEISLQISIAKMIRTNGVSVIIEGPGHCRPTDINKVSEILLDSRCPIMTLGPIPIDSAVGFDHIAAAIGATIMGINGCAHILSAVTREEHTGGIPTANSTIEAIECAHIAAKIIDLEMLGEDNMERHFARLRSEKQSCVANNDSKGCSRCSNLCPLIIDSTQVGG